jgi:hypothetical protein
MCTAASCGKSWRKSRRHPRTRAAHTRTRNLAHKKPRAQETSRKTVRKTQCAKHSAQNTVRKTQCAIKSECQRTARTRTLWRVARTVERSSNVVDRSPRRQRPLAVQCTGSSSLFTWHTNHYPIQGLRVRWLGKGQRLLDECQACEQPPTTRSGVCVIRSGSTSTFRCPDSPRRIGYVATRARALDTVRAVGRHEYSMRGSPAGRVFASL